MQNLEAQCLPVFAHAVQGAAIGPGQALGGEQNLVEQ